MPTVYYNNNRIPYWLWSASLILWWHPPVNHSFSFARCQIVLSRWMAMYSFVFGFSFIRLISKHSNRRQLFCRRFLAFSIDYSSSAITRSNEVRVGARPLYNGKASVSKLQTAQHKSTLAKDTEAKETRKNEWKRIHTSESSSARVKVFNCRIRDTLWTEIKQIIWWLWKLSVHRKACIKPKRWDDFSQYIGICKCIARSKH